MFVDLTRVGWQIVVLIFKGTLDLTGGFCRNLTVDTCGGTISGRHGRIAYKTGKNFDSNERCVWAIKPTGKSKIKVIFRSEAIEEGYDYVAVSTFDEHSTIISTK